MADEFDLTNLYSAVGAPKKSSVAGPTKEQILGRQDLASVLKQYEAMLPDLVPGSDSHNRTLENIRMARSELGQQAPAEPAAAPLSAETQSLLTRNPAPAQPAVSQDEFNLDTLKNSVGVPVKTEAAVATPAPKRMFEPKNELERKIQQSIESLPGSEQIGAFTNAAAATVAKSVPAITQLIAKYFPGISEEDTQAIMDKTKGDIRQIEALIKPIAEANPKSALAGEITGFVANPINKLVPGFGGPATNVVGAFFKGAGQGAIANVLTTPATSETESFATEKGKQAAFGGTAGGVFGVGLHTLTPALDKGFRAVQTVFAKFAGKETPSQLDDMAGRVLTEAGIDVNKIAPDIFQNLKDQAKSALQNNNVGSLKLYAKNLAEANELGIPMLKGQLNRDPMQYAVEQNLRGVQGVGEPIQAVMKEQNTALFRKLDELGATQAKPITDSGTFLRDSLKSVDAIEAQKVRDAYKAFNQSTGKNVDVPLQGLAQDYARITHEFEGAIPKGVLNQFEALGLSGGKQLKVTSIDDAENLIKIINKNYDPKQKAQSVALDELRRAVNSAIVDAGANLPGEAGALARASRDAASKRFAQIESIPALKDMYRGVEPDKFVQKHILNGNVAEITKMTKYLEKNDPATLAQLQHDVIGFIKNRVAKNVSDENAKFSQEALKGFVADKTPNLSRLKAFLTPEQVQTLQKVNRVAENIHVEPIAGAQNRSNTASAAANLVSGTVKSGALNEVLSSIASIKFPGAATVGNMLKDANQRTRASEMINQAVNPAARPTGQINLNTLLPLGLTGRQMQLRPGEVGAAGVNAVNRERNREFEKQ